MAGKYDQYNDLVHKFNDDFNVNFSFEEFDRAIDHYKLIAHDFNTPLYTGVRTEDGVYRVVFATLFKNHVESIMESKDVYLNIADFANRFEELMETYRKANNSELPHELGGWQDKSEMAEAMRDTVNSMNCNKNEHVKNKYLAGKIRLRDMRAKVAEVEDYYKNHKLPEVEDEDGNIIGYRNAGGEIVSKIEDIGVNNLLPSLNMENIMRYVAALEEVVASRSGWWKFFHPFRNNAEQRDLNAMKDFLEKYSDKADYKVAQYNYEDVDAKDYMLERIEKEFAARVEFLLHNEERLDKINEAAGKFLIGKKRYYVKEEPAPQEIPEGKHLVDKNLLKVNYVPDAENIGKELEELEKVQDHLKSMVQEDPSNKYSDYVSADGQKMEYQNYHFMKDVVSNNIKKINDVKADSVDDIKENIEAAVADELPYHDMDKIQKIFEEEYPGLDEEEIMRRMLTDHKDICDEQSANQWSSRNEKIMENVDARETKRQGDLGLDRMNTDMQKDLNQNGRENEKEVIFPNIIVSDGPRKVQVDPNALKAEVEGKANDNNVSNIIADDNLSKSSIRLNN